MVLGAILAWPNPTGAQEWNDSRVLEMVQEARAVRQAAVQDSTLRSYSSEARGFVYFYLDREDTGERILVKTDQIALDVFWQAPDHFKQRIVGLRDQKSLPTNIQYHLDHLVVVQDEFGDRIRIGDGDEVEAVVHPVAPGSEAMYDFLLADSITLNLGPASDTVRVYEVQVRPKDFSQPGFVGSLYLDRSTRSIVRMSFTFTPASYVDNYLDYIRISLENSLWLGKHWLPFRQGLEIRREVPYLDFPAGSVIRGSFHVQDYQINPDLPPDLFSGRTITALPEAARRAFPFEEGLYSELEEEGLEGFRPPPEMAEIRSLAATVARERYLSGLGRTRLFLPSPSVSSALRYNRAEGLFLGGGISHLARPDLTLAAYGGFSFGRKRPTVEGRVLGGEASPSFAVEAFWNRPRDLSPNPLMSGVLNSLSSAILEDDYTDLFFASGVQASRSFLSGTRGQLTLRARLEDHRSGRNEVSSRPEDSDFRPVTPISRGTWASLRILGTVPTPLSGLSLSGHGLAGSFRGQAFGEMGAGARYEKRLLARGQEVEATLEARKLVGEAPIQAHYRMGGRGTVPGYPFRRYEGDAYWLFRAETSMDLFRPYLRIRAFGAAARVGAPDGPVRVSDPWPADLGGTTLLSAGLGVGLGWDVLRLDLARGFRGDGDWELILSVNPDFWPWL